MVTSQDADANERVRIPRWERVDPRIQDLLARLEAGVPKGTTANQLAEILNMSPSYFSRLFARATGITPARYLKRLSGSA
jgi:transcriptional regulator GlxA family with amidase domain